MSNEDPQQAYLVTLLSLIPKENLPLALASSEAIQMVDYGDARKSLGPLGKLTTDLLMLMLEKGLTAAEAWQMLEKQVVRKAYQQSLANYAQAARDELAVHYGRARVEASLGAREHDPSAPLEEAP